MNIDKAIKSIRVAFAFIFGAVLMFYAIYGWHAEWTDDWQSIIVGLIGFVFMYMPDKLQAVISQGLTKIFELTIGRFFGGKTKE